MVVAEAVEAFAGCCGGGFRAVSLGVARGCPVVAAVGAVFVVVVAESIQLVLEFLNRGGCGSGSEPAFQGLVEAFDLALGLRAAGGSVLLAGAQER